MFSLLPAAIFIGFANYYELEEQELIQVNSEITFYGEDVILNMTIRSESEELLCIPYYRSNDGEFIHFTVSVYNSMGSVLETTEEIPFIYGGVPTYIILPSNYTHVIDINLSKHYSNVVSADRVVYSNVVFPCYLLNDYIYQFNGLLVDEAGTVLSREESGLLNFSVAVGIPRQPDF